MIQILKTVQGNLVELNHFEEGAWVHLVKPSQDELDKVCALGVDMEFLQAALDEEERARIESEVDQTLIIVDLPVVDQEDRIRFYSTIPLGIVLHDKGIVTVCLRQDTLIQDFINKKLRRFNTHDTNRFILQILLKTATRYLHYLRDIDKMSSMVERELHKSLKNSELIELLKLEKSLVYISTSLKSNEVVLEKLMRFERFKRDHEDAELLEDVIIENKQAIEMANIYSSILSGTMDAFASVISNNLNMVMKFLASVTIVLAIPTIVASFYGMNVALPLQNHPYAFPFIAGLSVALSGVAIFALAKRKMF